MSKIQDLLKDKTDKIDYDELLELHPWITEKEHTCILSPDSDGLLCGLFMSHFKNWKIIGFYDDKVSVVNSKYLDTNPIFLDGEIFRRGIRSMGHHMLQYHKKHKSEFFDENFKNCIQPNLMRNYDGHTDFRLKYPLANIHMLVCIVAYEAHKKGCPINIPTSAIPALFFTDGVFQVLFSYPENVLNWFEYLRINECWNPLKNIFENDKYTVFSLMKEMDAFFRERDQITEKRERGDRLRLSDKQGEPVNIENIENGLCHINQDAKNRIVSFINLIARATSWQYEEQKWDCWENLNFYKFGKGSFKDDKKTLTIKNFNNFINRDPRPLSWAMTSGDNIEYTFEVNDKFPFDLYK